MIGDGAEITTGSCTYGFFDDMGRTLLVSSLMTRGPEHVNRGHATVTKKYSDLTRAVEFPRVARAL